MKERKTKTNKNEKVQYTQSLPNKTNQTRKNNKIQSITKKKESEKTVKSKTHN